MKSFLYDLTNFGVIYVTPETFKSQFEINMFRGCILDIGSSKVSPQSEFYKTLSNETLNEQFYVLNRDYKSGPANSIQVGNFHESNTVYEEKKARALLLEPLIKLVTLAIQKRSLTKVGYFTVAMEDTIAREVENSDPANDLYTSGVTEYASTLGITNRQAYEELKLDYQTTTGIKMRAYAMSRKYQSLIKDVYTQEQADALYSDIEQKLFKETYI